MKAYSCVYSLLSVVVFGGDVCGCVCFGGSSVGGDALGVSGLLASFSLYISSRLSLFWTNSRNSSGLFLNLFLSTLGSSSNMLLAFATMILASRKLVDDVSPYEPA